MRTILAAFAMVVGACASPSLDDRPESIHVVYVSNVLEYSISDGGAARFVGGASQPVYEFEATREDFRRIADLLAPLREAGLTCASPSEHSSPGYIVWRRGDEEVRRVEMHTTCYSDGPRPLARNTDRAFRAMNEMGRARYVAPSIPDPTILRFENAYWGRTTSSWTIVREGEGRFEEPGRIVNFQVSDETFMRVRELLRPYEGRHFECNRVISDGPYGYIVWSSEEGREDQRTRWDAGCVAGDATDLFARIDEAMEILVPLRESGSGLEP